MKDFLDRYGIFVSWTVIVGIALFMVFTPLGWYLFNELFLSYWTGENGTGP